MQIVDKKFKLSKEEYENLTKDYGIHPCYTCHKGTFDCVQAGCPDVIDYNNQFKVLPDEIIYLAKCYNSVYAFDRQIEELEKQIENIKKNRASVVQEVNSQIIIDE